MRLFTCIYPSDAALDHLDLALQGLPFLGGDASGIESARGADGFHRFDRGRGGTERFRGARGGRSTHGSRDQSLRWVPAELRHITLVFHGDVPDGAVPDYLEELGIALRDIEPFDARLGGSGAFNGRTLWTGIAEGLPGVKALGAAANVAALEAGIRSDNRASGKPHLTLARANSRNSGVPLDQWVHALVLYRGPLFAVDEVHVVQSELGKGRGGGPLYSDVAVLPLGAGGLY